MAMRGLYYYMDFHCPFSVFQLGLECIEKSMKAFIMSEVQYGSTRVKEKFGHNISNLYYKWSSYNESFRDSDLEKLCNKIQPQKGLERVRYGLNDETSQLWINTDKLIPIVDRLFLRSLIDIGGTNNQYQFASKVCALFSSKDSRFSGLYQRPVDEVARLKQIIEYRNDELEGLKLMIKEFE